MFSIAASVMTGEGLIFSFVCSDACCSFVASKIESWPCLSSRVAVAGVMTATPFLAARFVNHFLNDLPVNDDSPYFQTMAPSIVAFEEAKVWGVDLKFKISL